MTKIGRNSLCPCGSGRKYKACCAGSASGSDFQFRLYDQLHSRMVPQLINFVNDKLGPEFTEAGWLDFTGTGDLEPFHPEGPMRQLFIPWLLFSWRPELGEESEFSGVTAAELFLAANHNRLDSAEKDFLLSQIQCPYTLCEVVDVKPSAGMTLFDLLRGIEYEVVERSASQTIKKGEIIYCATSELRGFRSNVGTGPYTLRPTSKLEILDLREWMVSEIGTQKITSGDLLEFEDDIRFLYLDLAAARLAPPVLVNSDGERIVPQKLYFDIDSSDEAFHALKFVAEGEDEENLLENAVIENGVVKSVEFPWLGVTKKERKELDGPVVLGAIRIKDKKLIIEVNSTERADAIRKIVELRLSGHGVYKRTMIESIESEMREMAQTASSGGSTIRVDSSGARRNGLSLPDDAEIHKIKDEIGRKHWENWFDNTVSALGGLTPREATKTEKGRDLLKSLLREYGNRAPAIEDPFKPDIKALRRKLGMD